MKEFLKTKKGKICVCAIAAAVVLLLAGAGIGGWQYWLYQQPKFQDVTIELGTTSLGLDQFTTQYAKLSKCGFASDISTLDIGKVGSYPLTLRHGRQEQTVTLTVQDTTAPKVSFVPRRTEVSGYIPKPEDFIESCSDLSDVTFSFAEGDSQPQDLGVRTLTVVVTDAHGNSTRQTCTLSYLWLQESVALEYGDTLTKAHVLLNPEKDADLIDQADLDAINAAAPGEYTVESTSGNASGSCLVTVADTKGPELLLQSVSVYVSVSAKQEDFIVSVDDPSGVKEVRMLTTLDFYAQGTQTVVFEAEDMLGNITTAETSLIVTTDITPPWFSGLTTIKIEKNGTPDYLTGVSATDAIDGRCSVRYNADAVDPSQAGYYYVTYYATDKSGNTAVAKRTVEVLHDAEDTQNLVNELAAKLSSDPEALRDYVRSTIYYSTNWGGDDPVWYGFKNKQGNCYVHALCLQKLLQYNGYNTQLIWTTCKTHYWLLIETGSGWKHIDPTPSTLHGKYSLMSDAQRLSTLSGRDWDHDKWPACS